jgi:WD40 repeat protein
LLDTASGKVLLEFGESEYFGPLSLSADGKMAITGYKDGLVRLWDTANGQCLRILQGHLVEVTSVSLSEDGALALSGSKDKTIRFWQTSNGRCLNIFQEHTGEVNSVSLSGNGGLALSGSRDGTLRFWQTAWHYASPLVLSRIQKTAELIETQRVFETSLEKARNARGRGDLKEALGEVRRARALTGLERSPLALAPWRQFYTKLAFQGLKAAYLLHDFRAESFEDFGWACLSGEGKSAFTAGFNRKNHNERIYRVWDTSSGQCLKVRKQNFQKPEEQFYCGQVSGDGRQALFLKTRELADKGREIYEAFLWDTETEAQKQITFSPDEVNNRRPEFMILNWDGSKYLTGGGGRPIRLWETASDKCLQTFEKSEWIKRHLTGLWMSKSGLLVLTSNHLWETTTGKAVGCFRQGSFEINGLRHIVRDPNTLSGDGKLYLSLVLKTGLLTCLGLWETSTGRLLRLFEGDFGPRGPNTFEHPVTSLCLNEDGRLALSGGRDGKVRVWDTARGNCVKTIEAHDKIINSVSLSDDGGLAFTVSSDQTAKLWFLDWDLDEPGSL